MRDKSTMSRNSPLFKVDVLRHLDFPWPVLEICLSLCNALLRFLTINDASQVGNNYCAEAILSGVSAAELWRLVCFNFVAYARVHQVM